LPATTREQSLLLRPVEALGELVMPERLLGESGDEA